jgi:hypothetical protein
VLVVELKFLLFTCCCAYRDVMDVLTVSLLSYVFEIVGVLWLL